VTLVLGLAAFGVGLWILVESVEGLIHSVRGWAAAAGISGVALGALILGFDIESTAAGVAATLQDLPGTALGTSIGAGVFLVTLGLGLAGLCAPFELRTPRPLLIAAAVSAAASIALCADGRLTRLDGGLLVGVFIALFTLILRTRSDPEIEPEGERPRRVGLRVAVAVIGVVAGAELLVFGTDRVVHELDISETVFGLIVIGAAVSLEEVVLELLPAFRGYPELSVGNALGTLVFLLTGSLGVIALARPLDVPAGVRDWHLPALGVATVLCLAVLARGRLGRAEGALLCAAYAVYLAGAIATG
jgi:cation:H+ antiporter